MKNCSKNIHKFRFPKSAALLAAFLLPIIFIRPAFGGPVIDRVIAIVGEEVITQSDLDRLLRSKKMETRSDDPQEQWKLTRHLIEERLILQEVKRKRIAVTDTEIEFALKDIETRNRFPDREAFRQAVALESQSWEEYVSSLKSQLLILKLLNREIDINISISPEAVQEYYDTHPETYALPDRVRLKQILLSLPANASEERIASRRRQAEEIYAEAQKGLPFDQLVALYSEGPEKERGGDLGFFNRGDLSPEIDRAVFGKKEGELIPPLQSPLGFHFFKVEREEAGRREPLEKVRKEIEERLISKSRSSLQAKWIDDLFEKSYIDIKP